MIIRGMVVKLGHDINTDLIIPGKYKYDTLDPRELARHAFEDLDPTLAFRITPGTVIVAGRNFGCGSSREQAVIVIKALGVRAVVAESVARIFFRNAINRGLAVVECREVHDSFEDGDLISVDLTGGVVRNETRGVELAFRPWPGFLLRIYEAGGLVEYLKGGGTIG